jgi:5'-3' exonuclease
MRGILRDEAGVVTKFGVKPESIPDYLALVGDSADGFPGLEGWGPKGASLILSEYSHFENIPKDWRKWPSSIRGAQRLAGVLFEQWNDAVLYRVLATLRQDVPVFESLDELHWNGPRAEFEEYSKRIQLPGLYTRAKAAVKS